MYTEICAELGATTAVASSAPYIQFSLILYLPLCLEVGRLAFFQHGHKAIILYPAVAEKLPGSLTYIAAGPNPIPQAAAGFQRDGINQAGEYKIKTFRVHPFLDIPFHGSGDSTPSKVAG
jgi:hypothetical protein